MFKVPTAILERILGITCNLQTQKKPEEIADIGSEIFDFIVETYSNNGTDQRSVIAALHNVSLFLVESIVNKKMDDAPDEIKRSFAMLNLMGVDSGGKNPDE